MTHASLFSGIGGFDLAAEWAGWANAFNCEINAFCRRILAYQFPNAVSYEDITATDFTIWRGRVDVLTGGFPCQPFSVAGKRAARPMTVTSGRICCEQFARLPRAGSWAKTFTDLLLNRADWYSSACALTWRMQGTRSGRLLFRLVPSTLPTAATDSGLLPTAQTQGLKICRKGQTRPMPIELLPTPTAIDSGSGRINKSCSPNAAERPTLALAGKRGLLPTPRAFFYKDARTDRGRSNLGEVLADHSRQEATGGASRLNPLFVEEMMGFPAGWTLMPFSQPSEAATTSPSGGGSLSRHTATPLCRK